MGLILILCFVLIRRLFRRRSYVYIDFISSTHICSIKLTKLPEISIEIARKKTTVRVYDWGIVGVIVFVSPPWKIVRGRDGKAFPCPSWIIVSARQARLVRAIQNEQGHKCQPLVVHSHHYEFQPVKQSAKSAGAVVDATTSL